MQRLEVSGAVRIIYRSLGVKGISLSLQQILGFLLRPFDPLEDDSIISSRNRENQLSGKANPHPGSELLPKRRKSTRDTSLEKQNKFPAACTF